MRQYNDGLGKVNLVTGSVNILGGYTTELNNGDEDV